MPPAVTELIAATADAVDRTTYTTASISPTAGALLFCTWISSADPSSVGSAQTVSGCGLTWTKFATVVTDPTVAGDTPSSFIASYVAYADPAVVTSGTLSLAGAAGTLDGAVWQVLQVTGFAVCGGTYTYVTNIATGNVTTDSVTITCPSALYSPNSLILSWAHTYDNGGTIPTITNPTGWTGLTNTGVDYGTEAARLGSAYNTTADTSADWAAQSINDRLTGIVCEVWDIGAPAYPRKVIVQDQASHRASRW